MGYGEFRTDFESIFERMSRSAGHAGTPNNTIRTAVVDHGNPATWHGSKATTTVPCNTDEEVYEGVKEMLGSHEFVFGRFTGLADALGCEFPFLDGLCLIDRSFSRICALCVDEFCDL